MSAWMAGQCVAISLSNAESLVTHLSGETSDLLHIFPKPEI